MVRCQSPDSPRLAALVSAARAKPDLLAALVATVAMIAGCGGRPRVESLMAVLDEASTDYHFFGVPTPKKISKRERAALIDLEIERLATVSWESARDRLFKLGKEVIPRLFANIERTEPTEVGFRRVPGPALPERKTTWNLGQVVYAVLVEFVGSYTNYAGSSLPPLDKPLWEDWWVRNRKRLAVYSELDVAPEYVRKQHEAMRKELARRFPRIEPMEPKEKKRLDLDRERAEAKRKEKESRRQLKKQKTRRRAAEARAASFRRRSIEEEAREGKVRIPREEPVETEPAETETPGPGTGGAGEAPEEPPVGEETPSEVGPSE